MTWVRSRIAGGFFWRPFYRYFVFRKSARKLDLFRKFVFIMLHSVRAADVAATREKSTESQVDAGRDFRISKIERDLAGAADTGNEIDSRFSNGKLTYIGIKSMRSRPEREPSELRSFSCFQTVKVDAFGIVRGLCFRTFQLLVRQGRLLEAQIYIGRSWELDSDLSEGSKGNRPCG
jgi:hypothetical protein